MIWLSFVISQSIKGNWALNKVRGFFRKLTQTPSQLHKNSFQCPPCLQRALLQTREHWYYFITGIPLPKLYKLFCSGQERGHGDNCPSPGWHLQEWLRELPLVTEKLHHLDLLPFNPGLIKVSEDAACKTHASRTCHLSHPSLALHCNSAIILGARAAAQTRLGQPSWSGDMVPGDFKALLETKNERCSKEANKEEAHLSRHVLSLITIAVSKN